MNQEQDNIMRSQEKKNEFYMRLALEEAKKAYKKGEVPVGAVVVYKDKVVARAHNKREKLQGFHAHAEFLAMQKASKKLKSWRLEDCDVYVTLEPCPMCCGAMIQSRIRSITFGTKDLKTGVVGSIINMLDLPFNHKVEYHEGVLKEECSNILSSFFKKLRE